MYYSVIFIIFLIASWCIVFWQKQLKDNKLVNIGDELDVLNLGSTYAFYDFDYSKCEVSGGNAANIPQYFDMDYILLKKYISRTKFKAKILFVIPDFVFLSSDTYTNRKIYYEALTKKEIIGFDFKLLLKYIVKAALEPFTHRYYKEKHKWDGYEADLEEKKRHLNNRIKDWEGNLGIPSVLSNESTEALTNKISKNITLLEEMVCFCYENNRIPVLIVPPVSKLMQEAISAECLSRFLFEPIEEVRAKTGVECFNYMYDPRFSDVDLYRNSDCLKESAAQEFTKTVLNDMVRVF